ncbi:MAG: inorganic pyrophosphatase Ppa [Proteobacteria bacterium]|nr:inorganic pyrophosphatase Ppa [Pseudomonadota bacterium]
MTITKGLQKAEKLEIQSYKQPKDVKTLRETHVPFSGTPKKHPYHPDRVILVADPYNTISHYYEFRAKDITFVEELPNIVNVDGETVPVARIWVKKKCVALQCMPFMVDDMDAI